MDGNHLRSLLRSNQAVLMPGVWDALSARLASDAGFEVLFVSGYATSASLLGLPDFGYLTQAEMADVARRVCRTVGGCAVVVDGDTGGGNALNTIRTIELFEASGAAGVFLEDQVWPKKCGHMAGKRVVPREEWLGKLQAALDHRWRLFVVARTDARSAIGLEEAVLRARMAAELGVDAVFVEAPESVEEMRAVAEALPGVVLVANMIETGKTPLLTPTELHDLGYKLIVSPLSGLFSMAKSVATAYQVLADQGTLRNHLDLVTGFDDFNRVVDVQTHYRLEARYQGTE